MSLNKRFPPKVNIVSSLELIEAGLRLDPTRYNIEAKRAIQHLRLKGIKLQKLEDCSFFREVYIPARFKRFYVSSISEGVPFLGSSSMHFLTPPIEKILSNRLHPEIPNLMIQNYDLLVSCSGTVGSCVVATSHHTNFALSQHTARLRFADDWVGFAYAFFCSPIGQLVLLQQEYGKVITHLEKNHFNSTIFPVVPEVVKDDIGRMVMEAVSHYEASRKELMNADQKLVSLLGLPPQPRSSLWVGKDEQSYLQSSELLFRERLDPHYYDPMVASVRDFLLSFDHVKLGEIASVWMPGRFKRTKVQEGHGAAFYSSADIMRARITPSSYISTVINAKQVNDCTVDAGTILICRSGAFGGIMGRSVRVGEILDGQAVTEDVVRVKVNTTDFLPDYVAALLMSEDYGYPVITACRYGKDVPHLDPLDLNLIPIPILPLDDQKEVAKHIKLAYESLDKANRLEEQAQAKLLDYFRWEES